MLSLLQACLVIPGAKTTCGARTIFSAARWGRVQLIRPPAWSVKFARISAISSSVKRHDTSPHRSMNERLSLARLRTFCNHLRYARGQPPADFAVRQQREVERWKVAYSKETSAGPAEAGRVEDMAAEAGTGSRFSVPGDDDEAPTLLPEHSCRIPKSDPVRLRQR